MKIIDRLALTKEEKALIKVAKEVSEKAISNRGHKIGCVIKCKNGKLYKGATNIRSRTIGSTCAERMALDQVFFDKNNKPQLCVLIGKLPETEWRRRWTDNNICTPCGVCLETFRQIKHTSRLKNIYFLCSSWNGERILMASLDELFPEYN